MSIRSATIQSDRPYLTLLEVYQSAKKPSPGIRDKFNLLPQTIRDRIFFHIADNQKMDKKWGEVHVFDSLPLLAKAISRVASETFNSLDTDLKEMATQRIKTCAVSRGTVKMDSEKTEYYYTLEILLESLDEVHNEVAKKRISQAAPAPAAPRQAASSGSAFETFFRELFKWDPPKRNADEIRGERRIGSW